MYKIGIIGLGYWGPNLVRNFNANPECSIIACCDTNQERIKKIKTIYPSLYFTTDADELFNNDNINIVAIATPVYTHYDLAKKALLKQKHVFLEKPMASNVNQCEELIELASKQNLKLIIDHTFIYNNGIRKIKEIIDSEELGDIFYFDSTRINLGLFQSDINVIWDLAPHDFSILNYCINKSPTHIVAHGVKHLKPVEDLAYIIINYDNDLIAHFNVNWLSPVKIRNIIIGGSKKMLLYNDLNSDEKVKIYDKGVTAQKNEDKDDVLINYRIGNINIPNIPFEEPLKKEIEHFIYCIKHNEVPLTDGLAGLKVIELLEATSKSLAKGGTPVKL